MSRENDELIDPRLLSAFQAAMSSGSMTGAARRLGVGQPTVTRLVRELEEAAGFQLFHRNGPRISPTARGLQFYEEVDRAMAGLRQIRARAEAIRTEREPSIDVAATPTMAGGLVAPTLALMGEPLPDAINVQTMSAENVARAVRGRTCTIGLSSLPLDHDGLTTRVVARSVVVAVLASDDPLAEATVPIAALAGRRLVTVGNAFRLRGAIDDAMAAAAITPSGVFATNSSLNAVMAARAGLGIALVDPVTAYGIKVEGVAVRPLETPIPYSFGLVTATERATSPVMARFIAAFATATGNLIPGVVIEGAEPAAAGRPAEDAA